MARLTRLESGPILATLARESAAIPASPEGIAHLFSLRVRQDAQLQTGSELWVHIASVSLSHGIADSAWLIAV
jgi:hypothetical protein